MLAGLERALATAGPATLAAMRSEIAAAIASGASLGQQARASAAQRTEAAELAATSAASRQQVQSLMRDMHRFDPYLHFASPEDEEAYRRRESERQGYIEQQHARGTPEGDLNAAGAAIGQMADAQAHGADRSPEFQRRFDELASTTDRLRAQVQRAGGSTRECDERLRDAMRSRGMSDSEIETRVAAHSGNPLEAVRDIAGNAQPAAPATLVSVPVQNIADAMAEFRAAGIVAADHRPADPPAHGLAAHERPAPAPGRAAG